MTVWHGPIGLIDASGLPFLSEAENLVSLIRSDGAGKRRIGCSPQEATTIQER
jgi:hypothetical protein